MCTILKITADSSGRHSVESQNHRTACWMEGWVAVPDSLVEKVVDCGGCCDLVMDGENLVDVVPHQRPEVQSKPSEMEQLRSDVDYLSMMTGVDLPNQEVMA